MSRTYIVVGLVLILIATIVSLSKDALIQIVAERGYAPAQFQVGFMYEYGKGVPQDDKQAAFWYRKAAEQDDVDAQFALGVLYYTGQGVTPDIVLAYTLFSLAASSGDTQAMAQRDNLFKRMSNEQIAEGETFVEQWRSGHSVPSSSQTGRQGQDKADAGAKNEAEAGANAKKNSPSW